MVKVELPSLWQEDVNSETEIKLEVKTVAEVVNKVVEKHLQLKQCFCDESGNIKKYIRFYINNEIVEIDQYNESLLKKGDSVSIIIPIAGG